MARVIAVLCSILLAAQSVVGEVEFREGCTPCERVTCPVAPQDCTAASLVQDVCDCCPSGVCGRLDGQRCYSPALAHLLPRTDRKYGLCDASMECVLEPFFSAERPSEAVCVCNDQRMACGSNNVTYDNACQIEQEFHVTSPVTLKHWGPCKTGPQIISPPVDTLVMLRQHLSLDCEAKGYPVPTIRWEFVSAATNQLVLPADDLFVTVNARGGPEPLMTTSWLQIANVRQANAGVYTCIAENAVGLQKAHATVTVKSRDKQ